MIIFDQSSEFKTKRLFFMCEKFCIFIFIVFFSLACDSKGSKSSTLNPQSKLSETKAVSVINADKNNLVSINPPCVRVVVIPKISIFLDQGAVIEQ